jgi:Flp pilus assembly protein TadD
MAQARPGAAQAAQGQLESAIPHLERAAALRPDDVDIHRWLGQAYAMQHQDALAVSHLTRALEVDTADPLLLSDVATLLAGSSDPSVAHGRRAGNCPATGPTVHSAAC